MEAELHGLDVRELLVRSVVETAQLHDALAPLLRSVRKIVNKKERIDAWDTYAAGGWCPPIPSSSRRTGIGRRRRRHRGPVRRSRGRERRVKGSRRAERGRTQRRVQAEGIEDGSENGARCRIEMKFLESETSPKRVRAGVR